MGGIGAYSHARPRVTEDIDVFIRPGDVDRVRAVLTGGGFEVVEHDPMWLVKGWKRGVLVDVIFRSSGGIYLDDEMLRRRVTGEYKGIHLPLIAPEDLFVIKRSEEHTSELQSLMRISYAVFCLKKKKSEKIRKTNNS